MPGRRWDIASSRESITPRNGAAATSSTLGLGKRCLRHQQRRAGGGSSVAVGGSATEWSGGSVINLGGEPGCLRHQQRRAGGGQRSGVVRHRMERRQHHRPGRPAGLLRKALPTASTMPGRWWETALSAEIDSVRHRVERTAASSNLAVCRARSAVPPRHQRRRAGGGSQRLSAVRTSPPSGAAATSSTWETCRA